MARKTDSTGTITPERAWRLLRLVKFLSEGSKTRAALIRHLGCHLRGFYRDLEILREVGILIEQIGGQYVLKDRLDLALEKLPFPDPGLTLGEAIRLAKGKTKAHQKIQQQLQSIES